MNPQARVRLAERPKRIIDVEKDVNTLFARTVLLSVAMLLTVHVGYRLIESVSLAADGFPSSAPQAGASYAAREDTFLDTGDATRIGPALSIRPRIVDLGASVTPSLRAAVWNAAPMSASLPTSLTASMSAFALADTASPDSWDDAPFSYAYDPRFAPLILSLPAALIALCAYWFCQMRRNLCELAQMARNADAGGTALRAPDRGVCDVRVLARALNDLMGRHSRALDEQSTALAAFSRQIDARVARLRTRALHVAQWHRRVGFIEDIDLFSNVARQFVDVVGRSETQAAHVCVDAWLHDRFVHGATLDDAKIVLRLNAGADFKLPRNALERLVGNLVGNALAHGAPPIEICTARGVRTWMLSVRDHGKGISESELAAATQPFVRFTSNETTDEPHMELGEHWGLGLAIVSRLAQHCGAKLKLGNHPEGGLWARVIVSMPKARLN
ncbi:integral membrane sensor signal transduction histidine kinase [Paraburkholderia hospita]|uniref:histidine kinase n=1 Tax=Paraburkholderia hospita TaxID=169430 RepID=A0AAN1JFN5_9BURK|nr:histidine kinase [Paraburkholderia hospita]EIM94815.1 integral membrane sensor signal transduction histidine kinase [Paraburkholderia hospita]OUL82899.1 histidine kinase [Paraburkholderia hospita]OUL94037.1 histidine kinase [Paraburkholderia hospita]